MKKVSHRKAPGAISAIALTVNPVNPRVDGGFGAADCGAICTPSHASARRRVRRLVANRSERIGKTVQEGIHEQTAVSEVDPPFRWKIAANVDPWRSDLATTMS